ncbi:protein TolR [Cupriavidus taiwanensis]|uniref:Membrane spanning protein in TolA-TolQ-TolR complex, inner membrane associated component n=1 Tax=Cupriavidus taiwanensis TaxID=164546 RepID=A0A375GWW4_9BURK|nr:protein TolR [Cupriavidus taiwanensis]SOY48765.1 membrane spanning protein in TolA-TolQ-TolR complex, inner membrane associated component [Cupriavidus taiwanensis]SOY48827.1 membrane spanning protein in TolA-TolQ-TolR complex, inner membrane associated component [Cupriavidus taiwanensis]SOY83166.1 membrane spanning protein in TolA-TolQ-TolR complex, inner membrane associated component [Cupriavidus taiwanensis]SOZ23184.1 membrane spanning protein in TolA-TolQ-TolR complex, inner membrane asso
MAAIQRRGGSRRRASAEINVVPYIDVMLVLLVIFMVAAPIVSPATVDLPTVANATPQQKAPPIVVTVHEDGHLTARGKDNAGNTFERKLDKQGLLDFVHQRQNENPDQPVVIAADRAVKYEAVLDVMSVLKADGVKRVGLMVKSKTS